MNTTLEKYLTAIDKNLRPLPTSERVDIVKEIKGSILEMEQENLPIAQILERLGNPKELAKAYLGDLLSKGTGFSWNRLLTICAFYSVVGFSGIIIIPALAIIAPVFIGCGLFLPVLGAVKMIDYIFHLGIPYIADVGIVLSGIVEINPIVEFIISIPTAILLCWGGRGCWNLLVGYCKKVSKTKADLSI